MANHHKDHPEYGELGIFAGYMEFEDMILAPSGGMVPNWRRPGVKEQVKAETDLLLDKQGNYWKHEETNED